jgi:hypothetical protein
MQRFGFLLKTYVGDFKEASALVESFNKHNVEKLPLDIVVPESEINIFQIFSSDTVTVLSEELIPATFTEVAIEGIRPGYINQEIVKLSFFRLRRTENYMCLDSDALFIRDFQIGDFIRQDGTPFTVLIEDRELMSDPGYRDEHWVARESQLLKIRSYLGVPQGMNLLTCHGFQILQHSVLSAFEREILQAKQIDFLDLLKISPYEFSWYNYFLQVSNFTLAIREPYFRVIHSGTQFAFERLSGHNTADWSNGYLGLVLNSNFQHIAFKGGYEASPMLVVATYLKTSQILRILFISIGAFTIRTLSRPVIFLRRILSGLSSRGRTYLDM